MPNVEYMFDSAFAEIYVNRMGKLKEFKTLPPFLPACFIRFFFIMSIIALSNFMFIDFWNLPRMHFLVDCFDYIIFPKKYGNFFNNQVVSSICCICRTRKQFSLFLFRLTVRFNNDLSIQ